MGLCKLADLKDRLSISGTAEDAALNEAIQDASRMVERHCNRTIQTPGTTITEYHDGELGTLYLKCFPAVSILSVKVALDYDFAGTDALIANEGYRLHADRGRLLRLPDGTMWEPGTEVVEVKYTGGYSDPDSLTGGHAAPPDSIQSACLLQAAEMYKRRKDPGYKSADGAMGGVTFGYAPDVKVIEAAQQLLVGERRILA
jgi:uncharacterized phiE125 gp8 family phage protein